MKSAAPIARRNFLWQPRAFSLIELLVVVAIFGILAVLAVPAFNSVAGAGKISRAGQLVADQLILAVQEATALNRDVEVRFIEFDDEGNLPLALQIWRSDASSSDASSMRPLHRVERLPEGTAISATNALSPLLAAASTGRTNFGGSLGERDFRAVRLRAGGSIATAVTTNNNFLTVVALGEATNTSLPPNYFALRINPVTGRVSSLRP
jgi:uncharacterized protein (TIGR02596 family)